MDRRCGRVTHSLFAESKKEANQAKNSHVSLLKSLNQGEKQVWAISLHPKVVQSRLVFVDAGLRYASGWVRLTDKQSTTKDSGIDRVTYVLWRCAEGVRKQGVIQAFHPIQSVKSTNRVMLCYTRAKSSQCVNVGVAERRQATQHMQLHEQYRKVGVKS